MAVGQVPGTIASAPVRTLPPDTGLRRLLLLWPNLAEAVPALTIRVQGVIASGSEVVLCQTDDHGNLWYQLIQPNPMGKQGTVP